MERIIQLADQALNNDSNIESGLGTHHLNAVAMSNTDHDELFGRQRELALLGSYLEAAAGGRSQVVLVVGEPGVGKTSLLDAIAAEALADSKLVLRGGASDAEGMPPYLPFLEAIGQYIRGANMHLLREQVGPAASIIASIFPELPLRLKDLPAGYSLPPEQARLRLYEAVSAFLGAIAEERPLLLVLDDLHWADSSSLDLFCYIARHQRHSRFLILGAFQEGAAALSPGLERMVAELNHHRRLAMLPLGGLDQNAMNALAQNQLGPVDPEVGQVLYAQSEGNPFFAEELLHMWLDTGALYHDGQVWRTESRIDQRVPPGIIAALRQRLARISPEIVAELRLAAIIGRTFDPALLAAIDDREIDVVEGILQDACRTHLIQPSDDGTFRFSHDKIRECLYAEISSARRRRLHEVIGRTLEEGPGAESPQYLADLAFHFSRSSDRSRGATYALQAGDYTLSRYAFDEALMHFRAAHDLLSPADQRQGELLLRLGETAFLAGAPDEAKAFYAAGQAWWQAAGDARLAAHAAHRRGVACWRSDGMMAARNAFEEALALLEGLPGPETVRVLVDLATLIGVNLGKPRDGRRYAERALDLARQEPDQRLLAAANRTVGNLLLRENELPSAIQLLEHSMALAKATGDPLEEAECCAYLATAYYRVAHIKRSGEISLRELELAQKTRDPFQHRHVYSWLAYLSACQGDWAEADRYIEQSQQVVQRLPGARATAFLSQVRGVVSFQKGDYARAEQELEAAAVVFSDRGPDELALCPGILGLMHLAEGKHAQAEACKADLEKFVTTRPTGSLATGIALSCLAQMALNSGDLESAERHYAGLKQFEGQCHWFLVDRVLAAIEILRHDFAAAESHLASAESVARREGLLPQLARVLEERAALEIANPSSTDVVRARDLLTQAAALLQDLGMPAEAMRVRDRINALAEQRTTRNRRSAPAGLSEREVGILRHVADGKSNREIADLLFLSEKTVANHLTSIFNKTNTSNRAGATAFAIRQGLCD